MHASPNGPCQYDRVTLLLCSSTSSRRRHGLLTGKDRSPTVTNKPTQQKHALDNHSRHLDPCQPEYYLSRGHTPQEAARLAEQAREPAHTGSSGKSEDKSSK